MKNEGPIVRLNLLKFFNIFLFLRLQEVMSCLYKLNFLDCFFTRIKVSGQSDINENFEKERTMKKSLNTLLTAFILLAVNIPITFSADMDMDQMKTLKKECMDKNNDNKMCHAEVMKNCEEKMSKKECSKMMKKMRKEMKNEMKKK